MNVMYLRIYQELTPTHTCKVSHAHFIRYANSRSKNVVHLLAIILLYHFFLHFMTNLLHVCLYRRTFKSSFIRPPIFQLHDSFNCYHTTVLEENTNIVYLESTKIIGENSANFGICKQF